MIITGDQIVAHLVGDYLLQSDTMALRKRTSSLWCLIHCACYTVPFLAVTQSPHALMIILDTHFLMDRWGLARYLVWLRNWIGSNQSWANCSKTGFPDDRPTWLTVWLLIIADNTIHLLFNGLACYWWR